jgi:molecular chaperone DnaK
LQGEREMARDNKSIGRFHLEGIPAAPRGVPQIEVTFDIDANGILHVSAKDLGTGKEQKITITASSGLTEDEIKNMVHDAESHADEDKKRRDAVETRNRADSFVYQTEKQLKENGDKIPEDIRKPVEDGIADLRKAIEADDVERMKSVMSDVESRMHRFAEELYKQTQSQEQATGPESAGRTASEAKSGGKDDVIDADFEMVDNEDKEGKE